MGHNPDNGHEWFTAGEAAELARRERIVGVPTTESGMIRWIKRAAHRDEDLAQFLETCSRKRVGKKGGGGTEYRWTVFPEALWYTLGGEIESREECVKRHFDDPAEWFSPEEIAVAAWLARLPSVPHRRTYVVRWLVKRARQDQSGFGAALKGRMKGSRLSPDSLIHMSAFEHDQALYEALKTELARRHECGWVAVGPCDRNWWRRR